MSKNLPMGSGVSYQLAVGFYKLNLKFEMILKQIKNLKNASLSLSHSLSLSLFSLSLSLFP
jgi:hypothetical protein